MGARTNELVVDTGSGFGVQSSGFRVQGSGFRVQGLGLQVSLVVDTERGEVCELLFTLVLQTKVYV